MNGEEVRSVSNAKYLGVTLDEQLTFNEHIEKFANKANQIKSFLHRNIGSCLAKKVCYKL